MAGPSRKILCPISGEIIQQKESTCTFLSCFEEIELLGKGGFGEVVKCRRKSDGMIFAMKKIDLRQTEMSLEEVKREAKILKKMSHPNIIGYYDSWVEESCKDDHLCTHKADSRFFYILMEFCPTKLSSYLLNVEMDMERRLDFIRQLVDAVSHIHSLEIIHRDLSCENILLDEQFNIKIIDFGLAVEAGKMGHVQSNAHGAHYYKAPELKIGGPIDFKVDTFSLGVLFFEILKDFKTDDERILQLDDLHRPRSRSLQLIDLGAHGLLIEDMLAHDPSQRPSASLIQKMMPWSDYFEYISVEDEQTVAEEEVVE